MIMKILPVIQNTCSNMKKKSTRLSNASREGYQIALRTSKIHNQNNTAKFINIGKSVTKKIAKETTVDDLPIIGGAIGMLIPLPLMSPILLGVGKLIQLVYKRLHKA